MNSQSPIRALLAGLAAFTVPAPAVIVDGVNGDALNNAGSASLDSFLSSLALPAFPYWNNLVRVQDSSGVYLGYNPSTGRGWVLTAQHIFSDPTTIRVLGVDYPVNDLLPAVNPPTDPTHNGYSVAGTDLMLYSIGGNLGDPALPNLPAVPILSAPVTVGSSVLVTGRGLRQQTPFEDTTAPYTAGVPGVNDAIGHRWGTNLVAQVDNTGPYGSRGFYTDFDDVGSPGVTVREAQAVQGDSGGGSFFLSGGVWQLGGITYGASNGGLASYGDVNLMTELPTYRSTILAETGTLVPEAGPVSFALLGLAALGWKRRLR